VVCEYSKHKFPANRYGSPEDCKCGMTFKEHCSLKAPKETYEDGPKVCEKYHGVRIDSFSTPRFNQGLGCFTSSIRETEKLAKRKGLEPVADARMDQIFREKDHRAEIRKEIVESRKILRAQAIRDGRL
jgi:hypothetical protein